MGREEVVEEEVWREEVVEEWGEQCGGLGQGSGPRASTTTDTFAPLNLLGGGPARIPAHPS